MDLAMAASYYDTLSVKDGYSSAHLFYGQMDLYGGGARDGVTSYRRALSAATISRPTRGVVLIGSSDRFIAGRSIKDYFYGDPLREALLIHPSDGSFTAGTAAQFITSSVSLVTAYMAVSLNKEQKEESESSQYFNLVDVYCSTYETVPRDYLVKGPSGIYYRVQALGTTTAGFQVLTCTELGAGVLFSSVSYVGPGTYVPATDSSTTPAPIVISGILERYQSNYRYSLDEATKFEVGDKVLTVAASALTTPAVGAHVTVNSVVYDVLGYQTDGFSAWELHLRRSL